ncbi:MAG TPA: histidine triad nucleotide-binding protein [Bacillota bacterium]
MSECIFCKIVKRELPGQIVFENDFVMVFKDINPVAPTHLLLIPKKHIKNICDPELLKDNLPSALVEAVQKVANDLGIAESGFRVVVNRGLDAGEAVPHLHFHLISGRKLNWPPG